MKKLIPLLLESIKELKKEIQSFKVVICINTTRLNIKR